MFNLSLMTLTQRNYRVGRFFASANTIAQNNEPSLSRTSYRYEHTETHEYVSSSVKNLAHDHMDVGGRATQDAKAGDFVALRNSP
ncbi:hypothetical protein [Endozoicomonas acroporae]|uniref:hypothetical protein n=1 Tax=Endozoicomonas acroporae TaxID=1701104 RepID=UPI0013D4A075|nr:hypothetical protein [Endozoicomonas acroporae]